MRALQDQIKSIQRHNQFYRKKYYYLNLNEQDQKRKHKGMNTNHLTSRHFTFLFMI